MALKFVGKVSKEDVPERRVGTPNPELVPIVQAVLDDLGEWFSLVLDDKKEAERTGESLRNQIKARGFNPEVRKQPKIVKTKKGEEKTKYTVYVCAHERDSEAPKKKKKAA